jgi:hypothetical protein
MAAQTTGPFEVMGRYCISPTTANKNPDFVKIV